MAVLTIHNAYGGDVFNGRYRGLKIVVFGILADDIDVNKHIFRSFLLILLIIRTFSSDFT